MIFKNKEKANPESIQNPHAMGTEKTKNTIPGLSLSTEQPNFPKHMGTQGITNPTFSFNKKVQSKMGAVKQTFDWATLEKDIDDNDFEMPENAIQCRMRKITKIKNGKRVKTIRRVFKMEDGTEEVHEDVVIDRI